MDSEVPMSIIILLWKNTIISSGWDGFFSAVRVYDSHQMSDVILAFASVLMTFGLICVFTVSSLLLGFDSHILNKVHPTMFYSLF